MDAGPGSPARPSPSTSPIPPKSPVTSRPQITDNEPVEASLSSDSTSSIQPTWPKVRDVDILGADAVAVWNDVDLPNLSLDLHWHPSSHHAFFKLHTTISLVNTAGGRKTKTKIYIYIYPERIRLLTLDPHPTKRMLGSETRLLKVELVRPPALILPKQAGDPTNTASKDTKDTLLELTRQTCFGIYFKIPHKKMSTIRIRELCAAAADAGLDSLAVHANIQNLYHGKGGQIIEGNSLIGLADEPPPQYGDSLPAELPPPHISNGECCLAHASVAQICTNTIADKGKKRRRADSSSPEPVSLGAVQALLDSRLSSFKQDLDDRLAMHKKEVLEMLITVRKEMEHQQNGIQDDLETRVQEAFAEIEDNVMRNLSEAPLTASLTFPQHPWY